MNNFPRSRVGLLIPFAAIVLGCVASADAQTAFGNRSFGSGVGSLSSGGSSNFNQGYNTGGAGLGSSGFGTGGTSYGQQLPSSFGNMAGGANAAG